LSRPQSAGDARSSREWFERARDLERSGHLTEAVRILDDAFEAGGSIPDDAFVLRARLFVRESPSRAIAFLTDVVPRIKKDGARSSALTLLGCAHARVGDFRSAQMKFDQAAAGLAGAGPAEEQVRFELAYHRAAALWMQRKIAEAEVELAPVLAARTPAPRVEALVLQGALHAAREKYEAQAGVLLEALRTVTADQSPSVYNWAHVTAQLASLGRELPNQSIRNAAFENVERIPWTDDLSGLRFRTLKAIGWRRALEGDYFNAFRFLKNAAACAPTDPWRVMAGCDRAYLAANLGEPRWAEQELGDAADLAERVEWRAVDGDERFALLLLAELHAPRDGALAMSYVARYQEIGDRFSAVLSSNGDRRVQAMVAYSLACVREHLGERTEAEEAYLEAHEIYDAIGYEWRAARAALGLARVAEDRPRWRKIARQHLKSYPSSWLMMQLLGLEGGTGLASSSWNRGANVDGGAVGTLTRAQHEIYVLLLKGISTRRIAEELSRSEFTVRNHVKAIFKKLNVNSRAALMAATLTGS
jgi:DNA-binding CsgD family transcriptional regulator